MQKHVFQHQYLSIVSGHDNVTYFPTPQVRVPIVQSCPLLSEVSDVVIT